MSESDGGSSNGGGKLTEIATSDLLGTRSPDAFVADPANIHRQFLFTPSTDETLKDLIRAFSRATGIDLKGSEMLRALMIALKHAAPELEREAARIGRLKRPKNDRGNEYLREQLERRLAQAIIAGIRASEPLPEIETKERVKIEATRL